MTWLDLPADHPFGVHNLPYGVFSTADGGPRVGVRVGDHVLDAAAFAEEAGMESAVVWRAASLNPFLGQGREASTAAREWLTEQLTNEAHRQGVEAHLVPLSEVTLHLPVEVADYVDFYASEHHATNVGRIFRPTPSRSRRTGSTCPSATTDARGRSWCRAYELGRALNPRLVEQQLIGGAWMGVSHALYETPEPYYPDPGHGPRDFNEYLMPGPGDICPHNVAVLERPAPDGPFGGKGPGEMCANPVLPAVANAIFNAVGVRIDDLPITPEKVLRAIRAQGGAKPQTRR